MCSDWRQGGATGDLALDEIRDVFSSPLFGSIEKLVLSGGEPTLREDLAQIAEEAVRLCPTVEEVTVLTNGLDPDAVLARVGDLLEGAGRSQLRRVAVSVSIDGCGEVHESIRRVPRAFEGVAETIDRLNDLRRRRPFYLCAICVVQPLNMNGLTDLSDFLGARQVPVNFVPIWSQALLADGTSVEDVPEFGPEQLNELETTVRQLEDRMMHSNRPPWREYFRVSRGVRRRLPCLLLRHFVGLDCDGTLFLCNADSSLVYGSALQEDPDALWFGPEAQRLRRLAEREYCPRCTISCDSAFTFSHEFFYYARFLAEESGRRLLGAAGGRRENG
jgi:sulfatase maturation enzyme AslB (radical SAM superfamily)